MEKINYKEIQRVATGGMMGGESLMITYEGRHEDYNENFCVQILDNEYPGYVTYYTLRNLLGYRTNDYDSFIYYFNSADRKLAVKRIVLK